MELDGGADEVFSSRNRVGWADEASFPLWAQDSMTPEIDISGLASGKNFDPPVSLLRTKSTRSRNPGVTGIPLCGKGTVPATGEFQDLHTIGERSEAA